MKTVFFYGLFMDPFLLGENGFKPANCRRASLNNFQLIIGEKATLKPKQGTRCYGTLMELDSLELERLYSAEGVKDYNPIDVEVDEMNGSTLRASTYVLSLDKISGSNSEYADKLADVLTHMKFPESYISEVNNWKTEC